MLLVPGEREQLGSHDEEARNLGIRGNVKFLGFRKDVSSLLQAMDILSCPPPGGVATFHPGGIRPAKPHCGVKRWRNSLGVDL